MIPSPLASHLPDRSRTSVFARQVDSSAAMALGGLLPISGTYKTVARTVRRVATATPELVPTAERVVGLSADALAKASSLTCDRRLMNICYTSASRTQWCEQMGAGEAQDYNLI